MDSSFSLARRCSANSSVLVLSSCLSISSLSSTDMTTLGCLWNSGATEKCSIEKKTWHITTCERLSTTKNRKRYCWIQVSLPSPWRLCPLESVHADLELRVLLPCLLPRGYRTLSASAARAAGNYNIFIVVLLFYRTILYTTQDYVDACSFV